MVEHVNPHLEDTFILRQRKIEESWFLVLHYLQNVEFRLKHILARETRPMVAILAVFLKQKDHRPPFQCTSTAVDQKFFLPMLEHFSFVEIQNLSSLGLDEAECLSYKIAYLRLPYWVGPLSPRMKVNVAILGGVVGHTSPTSSPRITYTVSFTHFVSNTK